MSTPDLPGTPPEHGPDRGPDRVPGNRRAGRRTAPASRTRPDVTTVVAVLVPVVVLLVAFLAHTGTPTTHAGGQAEETRLTRSTVVCPPGGSPVLVASTSGATGSIQARAGEASATARVAPGASSSVRLGGGVVVLTGEDDVAPGLVAGRFATPPASAECRAPAFDQWFTGVGAGAGHRSVLRLVNPDEGRAVVDVTVLGGEGVVDAPRLRGITVEGGTVRTLRLAEVVPRSEELALHVTVGRGRVAASVLDTTRDLSSGRTGDDGLASQDAPSRSNLLLGVPEGGGSRTLVLANPGASEGRATVSLVTREAVFAPVGLEPITLPPRSVVEVPVASALRSAGRGDEAAVGIQVRSTVPVTTNLSAYVERDLATSVPAPALAATTTAVLPGGDQQLVLGGARAAGVVTVETRDARGTVLSTERVEVAPGRGDTLDLSGRTRLVTVTPSRTPVAAVVLVTSGRGATVVRLREAPTTSLVPDVAPGRP